MHKCSGAGRTAPEHCVGAWSGCYVRAYGPRCSTAMMSHAIKNDRMLKTTMFNAMLLNLLIPAALSVVSSGTSAIRLTALVNTNADIIPITKEITIQSHSWFIMHCFKGLTIKLVSLSCHLQACPSKPASGGHSPSAISVRLRISRYSAHSGSCSAYISSGSVSNGSSAWLKRYRNDCRLLT